MNASPKEDRVTLLKPASQLERIEDESEDIYQTSLIDRYAARPDSLDDMCLAEFAANYTTRSGQEPDDETSDALPKPEREDKKLPRIQLKNGLGYMHKRGREAIIRFHRFNREKDAEKLYRSKLMLYLPWRNESTDLLGEYADFCSHYEDQSDVILANEQKYSHNASLIDEATDDLAEHGPPQHAWDLVAPGAAEQQARDQAEGVEVHHDIEQEDLDANARLLQQQQHSTPLTERFTAETSRDLLTPEEYRAAIRGLNSKQRQVVMFHREWCKSAITALRSGRPVKPYRVFLSGPGGVGKSHVISLIRNDTVKLLRLSGQLEPDDVIVLLTAPTGGAAFNILGMTLHSALLFSTAKFSNQPLTHDKLNTLRSKLSNLHLLIIDEVSMVGSNMLLEIHKRLQQLKGSNDDTTFGNVSILAVGDLFQLQPVAQPYVFDLVGDAYARLHKSGSLWTDEFSLLELDQIMRQKDDQQFAQLLGRVRKAECTDSDLDVLRSRACEESDPAYPHEAVHVYPLNKDVDEDNIRKLNRLAPEDQHVVIHAKDCTKDKHTRQLDMTMPKSKASTGGLVSELHLAVGAKVMLTVNVDVSDGLVNGARGTVEAIIRTGNQVSLVLVKFDHQRVGIAAISRSQYQSEHPSSVPISRHEALFNIGRNKTVQVSRRQFPLVLSWASTIHKVQGLTLDQIVVDMKGRVFNAGQAYVAFSRVKSLQSLFIKNFNPASIKVSASVISEMERLTSDRLLPPEKTPQVVTLPRADWIKIGHLNVRSYFSKLEDITIGIGDMYMHNPTCQLDKGQTQIQTQTSDQAQTQTSDQAQTQTSDQAQTQTSDQVQTLRVNQLAIGLLVAVILLVVIVSLVVVVIVIFLFKNKHAKRKSQGRAFSYIIIHTECVDYCMTGSSTNRESLTESKKLEDERIEPASMSIASKTNLGAITLHISVVNRGGSKWGFFLGASPIIFAASASKKYHTNYKHNVIVPETV